MYENEIFLKNGLRQVLIIIEQSERQCDLNFAPKGSNYSERIFSRA
jgi:hypothetical protein